MSAYKYCAEPGSEIKVTSHISGGGLNLTGCKKSIGLIIPDTQLLATDTPSGEAGVILVQLIEPRLLKVEVFPDKKLSDVDAFTEDAKLYER